MLIKWPLLLKQILLFGFVFSQRHTMEECCCSWAAGCRLLVCQVWIFPLNLKNIYYAALTVQGRWVQRSQFWIKQTMASVFNLSIMSKLVFCGDLNRLLQQNSVMLQKCELICCVFRIKWAFVPFTDALGWLTDKFDGLTFWARAFKLFFYFFFSPPRWQNPIDSQKCPRHLACQPTSLRAPSPRSRAADGVVFPPIVPAGACQPIPRVLIPWMREEPADHLTPPRTAASSEVPLRLTVKVMPVITFMLRLAWTRPLFSHL